MNGCFCSVTCLRLARDIVRAGACRGAPDRLDDGEGNVGRRCVLVVGVEVPSAHHVFSSSVERDDIIAMSLFSDGSGAAIVAPEGVWRFRETVS